MLAIDPRHNDMRARVAAVSFGSLRRVPGYRGRGLARAGRLVAALSGRRELVLSVAPGSLIGVPLDDAYWLRHLVLGTSYEPEIFAVLSHVAKRLRDVLFVDCGANCGYWSVVCTAPPLQWRCVAIEPAPSTGVLLERNAVLNGSRFVVEHAAIWRTEGASLAFAESRRSAASHVVFGPEAAGTKDFQTSRVTTTTIDAVVHRHGPDDIPVVVKLDVEDAEIPAMEGATATFAGRETLLVYEDHGNDPDSRVTAHVLHRLGWIVLHVEADGTATRIESTAEARSIKTATARGFNFFAFRPGGLFDGLLPDESIRRMAS